MRTQGCRDQIDWVQTHCHGLSKEAISEVKNASKFVRERAPYLELQTTRSVNAIRTIKDPIIQGKVLEMVKEALKEGVDPRTGERFRCKNNIGAITTPLIKWMVEYATTGVKPEYIPRGSQPKSDVTAIVDEIIACKLDRRLGGYLISEDLMNKLRSMREPCPQTSR